MKNKTQKGFHEWIVLGDLPDRKKKIQRKGLIDALSPRWDLKRALEREMRAQRHT
jgi:hypothetical protein